MINEDQQAGLNTAAVILLKDECLSLAIEQTSGIHWKVHKATFEYVNKLFDIFHLKTDILYTENVN